jgi:hypothetical protein
LKHHQSVCKVCADDLIQPSTNYVYGGANARFAPHPHAVQRSGRMS